MINSGSQCRGSNVEHGTKSDDRLNLYHGAEGVISGTVVCSAVIAAAAGLALSTLQLCMSSVGSALVYWLAHVHAPIGAAVVGKLPCERRCALG